jgi:hypothetical protein
MGEKTFDGPPIERRMAMTDLICERIGIYGTPYAHRTTPHPHPDAPPKCSQVPRGLTLRSRHRRYAEPGHRANETMPTPSTRHADTTWPLQEGDNIFFIDKLLGRRRCCPPALAALLRLLPQHPMHLEAPSRSISATSLVRWQDLGQRFPPERPRLCRGILTGWRSTSASTTEAFEVRRPEYETLVQRHEIDGWCGDIRAVAGFDSPAINLDAFATIDSFADARARPLHAWPGAWQSSSPLPHAAAMSIEPPAQEGWLHLSTWDGRLFLCTGDEPQRFAAAYRIAGQLRRPVPIRGRLVLFRINRAAVASLARDYAVFAMDSRRGMLGLLRQAMEENRTTWLWQQLPQPLAHGCAILLPRAERGAMRIADAFNRLGVTDLLEHLGRLAAGNQPQRHSVESASSLDQAATAAAARTLSSRVPSGAKLPKSARGTM